MIVGQSILVVVKKYLHKKSERYINSIRCQFNNIEITKDFFSFFENE